MKIFYLLLVAVTINMTACRTKDGEPGPAGESALMKQGSISGEITYLDNNENEAKAPFKYEYFESLQENKFYYNTTGNDGDPLYQINFNRRDLKDYNNYFNVKFEGSETSGDPYYSNINLNVIKVINNTLYEFYSSDDFEISNLSFEPSTGRLLFDFSGTVYYSNGQGVVTGKVDVILSRSSYSVLSGD